MIFIANSFTAVIAFVGPFHAFGALRASRLRSGFAAVLNARFTLLTFSFGLFHAFGALRASPLRMA